MIYITGDMHGDRKKLLSAIEKIQWDNKERIHLLITGDFGFYMRESDSLFLQSIVTKNPNLVIGFIDGNHEQFHHINASDVVAWNGGMAHKLENNIYHLLRGECYNIENKRILTFGGAASLDKARRKALESLQNNILWYKEELPVNQDFKKASDILKRYSYSFDYIVTHTAPREIIQRIGYMPMIEEVELTGFLEWVMYTCIFKKWFFGHFHIDKQLHVNNRVFRAISEDLICLNNE